MEFILIKAKQHFKEKKKPWSKNAVHLKSKQKSNENIFELSKMNSLNSLRETETIVRKCISS